MLSTWARFPVVRGARVCAPLVPSQAVSDRVAADIVKAKAAGEYMEYDMRERVKFIVCEDLAQIDKTSSFSNLGVLLQSLRRLDVFSKLSDLSTDEKELLCEKVLTELEGSYDPSFVSMEAPAFVKAINPTYIKGTYIGDIQIAAQAQASEILNEIISEESKYKTEFKQMSLYTLTDYYKRKYYSALSDYEMAQSWQDFLKGLKETAAMAATVIVSLASQSSQSSNYEKFVATSADVLDTAPGAGDLVTEIIPDPSNPSEREKDLAFARVEAIKISEYNYFVTKKALRKKFIGLIGKKIDKIGASTYYYSSMKKENELYNKFIKNHLTQIKMINENEATPENAESFLGF